jgi:hypothetical protein
MRAGVEVLEDLPGSGEAVRRHEWYHVRLKMWLSRGDPVRWTTPWGTSRARIDDGGKTLDTYFRYDREHLIGGLFHGCEGMNVVEHESCESRHIWPTVRLVCPAVSRRTRFSSLRSTSFRQVFRDVQHFAGADA